jgi:hypothetical protein
MKKPSLQGGFFVSIGQEHRHRPGSTIKIQQGKNRAAKVVYERFEQRERLSPPKNVT